MLICMNDFFSGIDKIIIVRCLGFWDVNCIKFKVGWKGVKIDEDNILRYGCVIILFMFYIYFRKRKCVLSRFV